MRPTATLSWTIGAGLAAFVALGASGQGQVASEEEAMQVAEKRSETMKSMGGSMRTLKRFVEGRGTVEDASAAAAAIADTAPTIPSLFPAGTGMAALPDSESKENIWEEWDEFVAGTERLGKRRRRSRPSSRRGIRARSGPPSATSARTAAAAVTASSARSATADRPSPRAAAFRVGRPRPGQNVRMTSWASMSAPASSGLTVSTSMMRSAGVSPRSASERSST